MMTSFVLLCFVTLMLGHHVGCSTAQNIEDILRELEEELYFERRLKADPSKASTASISPSFSMTTTSSQMMSQILGTQTLSPSLFTGTSQPLSTNSILSSISPSFSMTTTSSQMMSQTLGTQTLSPSQFTGTSQPLSTNSILSTGHSSAVTSTLVPGPSSPEPSPSVTDLRTDLPVYTSPIPTTVTKPPVTPNSNGTRNATGNETRFDPIPGYTEFMTTSAATLGLESVLGMFYGQFPVAGQAVKDKCIDTLNVSKVLGRELEMFVSLHRVAKKPLKSNIAYYVKHVLAATMFHCRMECRDALFARVLHQTTVKTFSSIFHNSAINSHFQELFTKTFPSATQDRLHEYLWYLQTGLEVLTQQYFFSLWLHDFNEVFWNATHAIQESFNGTNATGSVLKVMEGILRDNRTQLECSSIDQWEKRWFPKAGQYLEKYRSEFSRVANRWLSKHGGFTTSYNDHAQILRLTDGIFAQVSSHILTMARTLQDGNGTSIMEYFKERLSDTEFEFAKKLVQGVNKTQNAFPETLEVAYKNHRKELESLRRLKEMLEAKGFRDTKIMTLLQELLKLKRGRVIKYNLLLGKSG